MIAKRICQAGVRRSWGVRRAEPCRWGGTGTLLPFLVPPLAQRSFSLGRFCWHVPLFLVDPCCFSSPLTIFVSLPLVLRSMPCAPCSLVGPFPGGRFGCVGRGPVEGRQHTRPSEASLCQRVPVLVAARPGAWQWSAESWLRARVRSGAWDPPGGPRAVPWLRGHWAACCLLHSFHTAGVGAPQPLRSSGWWEDWTCGGRGRCATTRGCSQERLGPSRGSNCSPLAFPCPSVHAGP